MPNVGFHPQAVALFPQFVKVEQEAQFATMATTFRSGQNFSFVWVQLVQCFEPNAHWNPVVVVRHTSPSEVSSDQLDLHLRADFGFENVSEVPHFVGSASHKLIKVNKLRNFSISGA